MLRVEDLKDCITFWDFDGVLMPYRATPKKTHINQEDYIARFIRLDGNPGGIKDICNYGIYDHLSIPNSLVSLISGLDPDKVYVLSSMSSSFEYEAKRKIISETYTTIKKDHILFCATEHKHLLINSMYRGALHKEVSREKVVMIDDTVSVLEAVEKLGFTAYHNSMLIS